MVASFPPFAPTQDQVADMMAIQNTQATYMECLGAGQFGQILGLFDLSDPHVTIAYGKNPPKIGADAVRAEWAEFTKLFAANGQVLGAHMLTTPKIEIEGDEARGSWMSYGFTFMGEGFGLERRVAMPSMSAYRNVFRKVDGAWRIARLQWDIIATLKPAELDPEWGWVHAPGEAPFPYHLVD